MKWFVGLGNPGKEYRDTRHNIGFMAVDRCAERWGLTFKGSKFRADIAEGTAGGQKVALIKPLTYMNLSGEAVRAFMDFYKADLDDLVVLYDDLDTPFAQMRLRYQGSAGGHNGIKSIIQHVGTERFKRIRLGISRPAPGWQTVDYVLGRFTGEETKQMPGLLDEVCAAMDATLSEPFDKVMASFNGKKG